MNSLHILPPPPLHSRRSPILPRFATHALSKRCDNGGEGGGQRDESGLASTPLSLDPPSLPPPSQPERSKHCSVCNLCRYRFDHHCNWIGSCVAEDNTREFTLYLNLQVVGHTMFLYMCYLVGLVNRARA